MRSVLKQDAQAFWSRNCAAVNSVDVVLHFLQARMGGRDLAQRCQLK